MKIAHVFNLANDAYAIVKALRKNGLDAELIINSSAFGMGLPMWEDMEIEMDPYNIDIGELLCKYDLPEWIKIWWSHSHYKLKSYFPTIPNLFKMTSGYDSFHCHAPSSMYLQFLGKPYIVHEAGWIRKLASDNGSVEKLGRRSYARAKCIMMTNPDTYPLLYSIRHNREKFLPFVIDPEQYKPGSVERRENPLLFFHPARHVWDVKGNDKLIHAFSSFIKEGYHATLRMVDWGWHEDTIKSKELVRNLKLEDHIEWVPPYSKPNLIKAYNESDAVFDQFIVGSGGTGCFEALSCSRPVAIYLNKWNQKCFGEMPPVENCFSIEEIYNAMIRFTDENYRRELGRQGRKFVFRHNHPDIIANELIKLYEEVFN